MLFGFGHRVYAQTSTEFWFAPPELTQGHVGDGNIFVRLAANDAGATVTIDMPANPGALNGGIPITVVLAANESQTVDLTAFINTLETRPQATVLSTGLHITATEEITAIYEAGPDFNVDIWALKGTNGLGTEFYVPMQNLWPNGNYNPLAYSSFDIVATEDNTTILIYPTSELDLPNGTDGAAGGQPAFQSFTITLDRGETYSAAVTDRNNPDNNPSGSVILSDKPIAVSIKDDSISPPGQGCREAVGDQIVPVDIVGNEYIINKGGLNAGSGEFAYVIATANNTQISVDGVLETILFNGETFSIPIANDLTYITGDKNFYLIHVSGFGCESGMAQLPPLNCAGSEQVSFVRSTTESFFINLLVPAGAEDDFVLNGDPAAIDPAVFAAVPGTGGAWVGAQIEFTNAEIAVGDANLITNSEEVFSLGLINGGAFSGCRFGYFSEFAAEIIVDAGPDQTVCANRETQLAGSVTGGATNGVWSTNGTGTFSPDATDFNAIYEPSLADLSAGTVTLTLTSVSNCFPVEDEVVITYTPAPVSIAGADIAACENNTTVTLGGFVDIATGGIWSGGAGAFAPSNGQLNAQYTPTAAEVTAGSVRLFLTTTGNGTCLAVVDSLDITFGPAPTADAGIDQTLCGNNADAQLLGAVTIATGGTWSGGTGTFDPSNNSLSPIYTPSPTEILNGSVTLTLTTTGNGGCNAVTDNVTLTFTDAPTVDAGSDQILCENNADVTLNGTITTATGGTWTGGTGTFNPDANTLNAVYTPSFPELLAGTVTLTLTSTGNGDCNAVSDNMTITFTDAPTVNAGADGSVCENNADIVLNGSLVGASFGIWSGGAGSFSPSTTDLNATYTPTAAEIASGSVTLTLTSLDNGTCNAVTDDVTYTFTDAPTANAGVDQSVCENNADITLAGSVTIATGGQWSGGAGIFTPDANTLNAIYTPTAGELFAGSVTLTLTTTGNGTCSPVTDQVTITFTDAPTANAGIDQTVCSNNAAISLIGSVTIATGGVWSGGLGLFTPDANSLNAVYTPTATELASGSITLTLTTTGNGTCNQVTDDVTITFSPSPVVEAGAAISVCSNNAQVSLNGSVTVAGGGTWTGGAGTFIPDANSLNTLYNPTAAEIAAGTLNLTLTSTSNGTCNPESDIVTVTFTAAPTANAGIDQTVCANNPLVNLNGNVSLATGGQWTGGNGIFNPDNSSLGASYTPSAAEISAGSVTLTLTTTGNGNCLAVDDAMTISITPAPVVDAGTGSVLCANNADITLNGSVTVATGGTWSGGSGTFTPDASTLNAVYSPSATDIANGSVTLTLTSTGNGDCATVTDNVTYTFSPAPTANAGADIEVCENNASASLNGSVTIAGGGVWSGGAGIFTPNANDLNAVYTATAAEIMAGSVTLTLTTTGNGTCNPVTDVVEISFTDAPTVNAGSDVTVCANSPDVNLSGTVTIATGGIWSGGGGVFSPNNTALGAVYTPSAAEIAAGTVTLTLNSTGNGDCNAESSTMTITITPAPVVDAGTGFEVCGNNSDIPLGGSVTIATGGAWTGGGGTFTPDANDLNAVYTPTLGEIASGTLTLTLTSTGNGNCLAVSDNVTYTFGDSPTVNAGVDQVLCSNNAEATLAGAVTISTGGVWSGGAGTFTPNANTLNAVYTPSAAELSAGSVTLTLTTTGNGTCVAISDDMVLTFTPAPTANAGIDQTVCGNSPDVNLSGSVSIATGGSWSGGFGSFNPSANSLFATYTPSLGEIAAGTVTLTLTTTGNGTCTPVTDDIVITITDAPTADAGPDATFCENNANITLGGAVTIATGGTWSGGSGTFNPNPNTLNAIYSPSAGELTTGSVTLTLTTTGNGDCVAESDMVTYTFTDGPTVDAGPDQTLCENNADVSLSGSFTIAGGVTWSGGGGSFTPSANDPNATYTPTATEINAGAVTLTLTTTSNGTCLAETDNVTITFTDAPTANAGVDQTVCGNDPAVNLSGSVTIATGGSWSGGFGTFTPNANSLFATYTPSLGEIAAGSVTLTLTTSGNGNCIAVTDDIVITITDAPTANAGIDATFCENNADITLGGSVTVASGGTWTGGNGTFTPDANTLNAVYSPSIGELNAGSVTLTLTTTGNGDCIEVTDEVTYSFSDAPTVDAGADQDICENNANVTLNGSVTIAAGAAWSGGAGTFNPSANALNAVYTPTAAELAAGSLTLTLTSTGNGTCNPETDVVTITFTDAPTATAGVDQSVCANSPNVNLTGSVTNATGGTWSGGFGTFVPNANSLFAVYTPSPGEIAAGTVTLTLTTTGIANCNPVTDQIEISITDAPTANAGVDDTFCANNANINLNGSVTIATGGTWSGGSGTFTPDANTLNAVYTPSGSEILAGAVTLTLTTTGNGDCTAVTDEVTYTLTPAPTVDAGADIDVCSNNADVSLNGAITIASGAIWSGGAGTFTPNANTLNASYTPTAAEISAGTLTLTLTTTGNGDCNSESDVVEITFTPSPTASAGTDVTVCANSPDVSLNGFVSISTGGIWSGGNGVFTPNNTTLGAVYTPSAAEIASGMVTLTLTTTGNGDCNAVTDNIDITITPAPIVNAGADTDYCANNADIELNGSVTVASGGSWSGGAGTFTPDANTLNATYTPSAGEIASGSLTLTLTSSGNGDCVAVSDQVTFTFSDGPTVDAGADQDVCENNADISLNGTVTIASGGVWSGGLGSFNPSANSLNATYTPTAAEVSAGSLTLTLTTTGNGTCNAESDNIEITFTPSPTANAGADQDVCANDPDVVLNGSIGVATGGIWSGGLGTFNPNNTTLGAVYTPSVGEIAAGIVTLTLMSTGNGNCNPVTDQIEITITPAPVVNAGTGIQLCANNPDISLAGSVSVATGGTWSGGGGTFTPDANTLNAVYTPTLGEIASGSITLTLTSTGNGNCIGVSDDVTYTFGDAPTVDAGIDQTLCENNSAIALSGAVTIATGGVWSGGSGTYTPSANTLNATYTPTAAELIAGSVTLTLTTTGNGNCTAVSDDITVTFTPAPTATAGADQTVCGNNPDVNLSGSVSIATGGTWSGGFGTFSPNANSLFTTYTPSLGEIAAGTVTLTLTTTGNGNCTAVTDNITITITDAPTANAGADASLCENNANINLNGVVTVATGASWSGGTGTFTPDANTLNAVYTPSVGELTAGSVTLTLTTTGNGDCLAVSDEVTYTFTPAPTIDAGVDQVLCENNADVSLSATLSGAGGVVWSGGAGTYTPSANALNITYTPTAMELAAGSVTLSVSTTGNGTCLAESDNVEITFTDAPTANAGTDQTVCSNSPDVNLTGSVTIATGGTWSGGFGTFSPNANSLFATYTPSLGEIASGTVTLTLTTTGNGNCTPSTDQITITIAPPPIVDAGVGSEVCANNANISLSGTVTNASGGSWSGGSGTFTPDANDLNAVYTPSASEIATGSVTLMLTSTGNGDCIAESDNVTYTFGSSATADAGADITTCANNANITLNGSVTIATGGVWSGGTGTFSPSANSLNASYTPSPTEIMAGTVTLTLTTTGNGDCLPESDDITITFTAAPTASAGSDLTVCANNAEVSLNGTVSIATGGTWSGGSGIFSDANILNPTYTPSAAEITAGTVTLTLTTTGNGDCNSVSDDLVITITPQPTVDAGAGFQVCGNNSDINLNGSVTTATGGSWSGGSGSFTPNADDLNAVYTPSATEIAAGSVTLTLTTTGNGDCDPVSDNVTFTFGPSPTSDAGVDIELCANNATAQLTGSVTIATGGTWSGGAGIFTPNENDLNAEYTPTPAEIAAGSVVLTLTTTGNGSCLAVSDDVEIEFTPAPTANAGIDQNVCENDPQVTLTGFITVATGATWSGGTGVFTPDASSLNATYLPSAAEIAAGSVTLTLTTTGNGDCLPEADQMTITIDSAPEVLAGADQNICSNNPEVQLNGNVNNATGGEWSGGLGTFSPDNATLNAVYTPSAAEIEGGSITLTLTSTGNGNCLEETDELIINFTPSPTVEAGDDIALCAGTPAAQLNGTFTVAGGVVWTGGAGSFTPNDTDPDAIYTPTVAELTAGSVILTLTTTSNGDCLPVTDDVMITFDPIPTVSAGSDLISCANNPTIELQGTFTNASGIQWSGGTGFFNPNDETTNAIYTPSPMEVANGFVTLTIASVGTGECPQVTDQMNITITPAPVVDAGVDQEACANNSTVQLSGTVQFASGGEWSGGAGTFTPSNSSLTASYQPTAAEIAAGSVTLTLASVGNGDCDAVSDQMTITFTPAPVIDAGVDQTICVNNAEVQLTGSFTVSDGANWSGGAGSFNPDNTTPNAVYTPSPSELANGSVTLTYTTFGNGNCLPVSDQMTITFTPAPEVEAGEDYFACVDNLTVPLEGSVSGSSSTGNWSSSGTGIFVPNASTLNASYIASSQDSLIGQVTLTLSSTNNGNCSPVTDVMTVFILPAGTANAGADQFVCENNATVAVSGTIGGAASQGIWVSSGNGEFIPNNQGTDVSYVPSDDDLSNGSVTLTFQVNSCNLAEDDVLISFTPAPIVNAGDDIIACSSESAVSLNGLISGATTTGAWSTNGTGSFSPSISDLNAQYVFSAGDVTNQVIELYLTSTNFGDCIEVTDTLVLEIFPQGAVNVGDDIVTCDNAPNADISATINGGDEILWTSSGSGVFTPDNTSITATYEPSQADLLNGSVTLTATVTNSCNQASDDLVLSFIPGPRANAGMDQAVCGSVIPFAISGSVTSAGGGQWSTMGSGSFQNANDLNTFYVASQDDIDNGGVNLILSTTGNGTCFADSDTLFLDISTGIEVNAGPDQMVCTEAGSIQLIGQISQGSTTGVWTSSGTGSFSPSANSLNAVYNFTQVDIDAGSITLTLTSTNNGICAEQNDSFELSFGDGAFVFGGENLEVCETENLVAINGVVNGDSNTGIWSSNGTGVFFPTNTSLSAFYEPSQEDINAGSVEITLTSTNSVLCNESSSTFTIDFQPLPVANAGEDVVVCGAIENIQLLGSVQEAGAGFWTTSGSGIFIPDANSTTAVYLPSEADSISGGATLTLTTSGNGLCEASTDEMDIIFSDAVSVDAGINAEICEDEGTFQLGGNVQGASSFNWTSSGSGGFSPQSDILNPTYEVNQSDVDLGEVTLYLTAQGNGSCPAVIDSITVTVDRIPDVEIIAEASFCTTNPEIVLNGNVSNEENFVWSSTGAGTFNPDINSEELTYLPSAAEIGSGSTTITLTASSDGVCGTSSVEYVATFIEPATVSAGADQVFCSTDQSVQLSGSSSTGSAVWTTSSFGEFDPNSDALDATYVFGENDILVQFSELVITSAENGPCEAISDTVRFTINPAPVVSAGTDQYICEADGILNLSGSAENFASIEWNSNGDGSILLTGDEFAPDYILGNTDVIQEQVEIVISAIGLEGCAQMTDTMLINISAPLRADFEASIACVGSPVQFTNRTEVFEGEVDGYTWDFGNGVVDNQQNPTFVFSEAGTQSVQLVVESSLGCSDTIVQAVSITEGPQADFSINQFRAPINFDFIFTENSSDAEQWSWNFGDGLGTSQFRNPTYSYPDDGEYTVTLTVTNSNGCVDSTNQTIFVEGQIVLPPRLPNSFSPNGDNINDIYYVRGGPFTQLDFNVYDNWGRQIFQTTDQEVGWDGTVNGNEMPVGVYVYTIKAINVEGESYDFTGQIKLFR